jgi:glycosyltransferase involved in cell wall biosynthesis
MSGPGDDVTIVVTCYQQEAYIAEAVESALGQSWPAPVLLVDDGSTDRSVAIAQDLGATCHVLPHRGALATFRAGVDLVETPFYLLLNGDDVLDRAYVERTRPPMRDPGVGFVYTGFEWFGAAERTFPAPPFDVRALAYGNYIHAASLVRTEAYRAVGGFDERFADHHEDWALFLSMARAGWDGVPVDEPLLRYRQHESGSRNRAEVERVEAARWRLFRRDPGAYGLSGAARLLASRAKLAVTGS